jgi:hypothetical protein
MALYPVRATSRGSAPEFCLGGAATQIDSASDNEQNPKPEVSPSEKSINTPLIIAIVTVSAAATAAFVFKNHIVLLAKYLFFK